MRKIFVPALVVVIAFGFGISAVAAPVPELNFAIQFDGEDFTSERFYLWPESTVGVEILFSLSEGGAIGAGFDLSFAPELLQASNLQLGPGWMNPGGSGIDNTGGHVYFEGLSVTPIEGGLLIAFDFTCTGLGLTQLTLGDLNDQPNWLAIVNSDQFILDDQLIPPIKIASVNQQVPIPGAIWLLGAGFIWMLGLRKKF